MRFEVPGHGAVEIDVDPEQPLGELRRILDWPALYVEGSPVDESQPVGTVWDGARLDSAVDSGESPIVELVGVSGLDAGSRWRLAPGRYHLWGAGSPRIDVDGVGGVGVHLSSGPVWFTTSRDESTFSAAGTTWLIRPPGRGARPAPVRGRRSFNRPPRPTMVAAQSPVEPPALPEPPEPRARLGVAMLIGPLLIGALMAVVFRPEMALIALIGPLMMGASFVEDRWRLRRQQRRNDGVQRAAFETFAARLGEAAELEAVRRRAAHPDMVRLVSTVVELGPELWERRPHHPDFLSIAVGRGTVKWEPPIPPEPSTASDPEIAAIARKWSHLTDCPVTVDLRPGSIAGIAGRRSSCLAVASAVAVRLAVQHGPADVGLAVLTDHPDDWAWCGWLPHTMVDPLSGRRRLASAPDEIERVVESLAPGTVVFLDHSDPALGARLVRLVESGGVGVLALAAAVDDLPGSCAAVVEVNGERGRLVDTAGSGDAMEVAVDGVARDVAALVARNLYGIDDPEQTYAGSRLPPAVAIAELIDPDGTGRRWSEPPPGLRATVGLSDGGPFTIDLVADGPHMLVAGTTGSGKSEFLRSLIASLAGVYPPDHVTFALVDYKGGSAFDACAGFPHVAGLVTDLDRHLSSRALESLEAEVRFRERRLREVGAEDVDVYRLRSSEPLPRLVVVVDEFAALTDDLERAGAALGDIARRGRSLGIHLVLATQRPAGVVAESIRANTNIRVALRVHAAADSSDIIDDPIAARVPRRYPGRGFVRLGPGEVISFQAAHCTASGVARSGNRPAPRAVSFGWEPVTPADQPPAGDGGDLRRMVDLATSHAGRRGLAEPRAPWAPPFPEDVELSAGGVIGMVDRPDLQRIDDLRWSPESGGLLAFGLPGSGASGALRAAVAATTIDRSPEQLQVYVIDGGGALSDLAAWPFVGAVIGSADLERTVRLVRHLHETLTARRRSGVRGPVILFVVDAVESVMAAVDGSIDPAVRDRFTQTILDGPAQGIVPVLSGGRPGAVPSSLMSSIAERLYFRLADPMDYGLVGRSIRNLPDLGWGRGFDGGGRLIQIGRPSDSVIRDIAAQAAGARRPPAIEVLPDRVPLELLAAVAPGESGNRFVPFGVGDRDLAPVGFHLHEGDHVLIAGPARSGRTTALMSIGSLASAAGFEVVVLGSPGSPLRQLDALVVESPAELAATAEGRRVLALIDDAERVDHPAITDLLHREGTNVIAAGRAGALRGMYQHWTRDVRRCRLGLSLQPQSDVDGELWQMQFPRRGPSFRQPGRGYLVSGGEVEIVQVAAP